MDVTRFTELWNEMRKGLQDNDAGQYSAEARQWAVNSGLIAGNGTTINGEPNCMWQDKLVEYVQKATKEKNWNKMLDLVIDLMEEAETKFAEGADRKEWVLAMVKASADSINYDVDIEAVGAMIDSLCDMSKVVNATEANA